MLIAYRPETLFHTLLLVADANQRRGAQWQTRLLAAPRWQGAIPLPFDLYAKGLISEADLLHEVRHNEPFANISRTLRGEVHVATRTSEAGNVSRAVPAAAAVQVLLVNPTSDIETTVGPELDELLVMVNGSAAVTVHGNLEAERQVDAELDGITRRAAALLHTTDSIDPSVATLPAFAETLLTAALRLTNSRLGNVYLAERDGEHLKLLAHCKNASPRELIQVRDLGSVVSWVYGRGRPMVINNVPDYLRVHPMAGVIDVAGDDGSLQQEIAVPIIQFSLAGGASTIIGVVNVERLKEDSATDGGYSYRDVTVLHAVAHRIALWRASSMMQQTSATLAELMKMSSSSADWQQEKEIHPAILEAGVPADALVAYPIIEQTLKSVYRLTRSYTATLSILSPDRRWLTRFASFPPPRMHDPHNVVPLAERRSVVAWVARTGSPCYLGNVRDPRVRKRFPGLEGYLDVGTGTVSELAIPLFVNGRIIGVLDLESRFRDGYIDSLGTAVAVAEQVGLAIQLARRFHEQEVVSMSTATTASVHELGKLEERLRKLDPNTVTEDDLVVVADGIRRCCESGAEADDAPPQTTAAIVEDVVSSLALEDSVTIKGHPAFYPLHAGAEALALRVAFTAILENAFENLDNDDPTITIAWRDEAVGGKQYLTLVVGNRIRWPVPDATLRALYRKPFRRRHSARTRLGAFTAGSLIRSLGGDVFVERATPPHFLVGIDIPVVREARSQNDEEAA